MNHRIDSNVSMDVTLLPRITTVPMGCFCAIFAPSTDDQSLATRVEKGFLRFHNYECLLIVQQFMDKKLFIHLQGGRKVSGVLRGYDLFLNLVIDDALEETTAAQKHPIGTVVIRGNSVTSMETLESIR